MNKPGSDSAAPGRGSGGRGAAGKNQNRRGRGAGRGRENAAGSKERDASSKDTEGNRGNARTGPAYKPYNNNKKKKNNNNNNRNNNNNNLDREFKICVRDLPVHGFGDEEFLDAVAMLEEAFLPAWTRPEPEPEPEPELEPEPEAELATEGAGAPPPAPDGEATAATAAAVKEKPPLHKPARPKHPQAGTLLSVSHLLEGHVSRTRGPLPGVGFIRVRQEALFQGMLRCGAAISRQKHAHKGSPEGETAAAAAAAAVVGADTADTAAAATTEATSTATATISTATDADAAVAAEEEALASAITAAYPNLQLLMECFAGEHAAHPDFEAAPYVQ